MVTELLEGGELFERCVEEEVELAEQDCVNFMRQVCRGVEYLHSQYVVHLDLKVGLPHIPHLPPSLRT